MTRLRALLARWRLRVRCLTGHHRETCVTVYGELRIVCLDCPYARALGRVRMYGSNRARHRWEDA
jgi:hypothetical protein